MEQNARHIIFENKGKLEKRVDKDKLKPFLIRQKIFSDAMLKDIYDGESDIYQELLSRGPNAFVKFLQALRDAGYHEEAKALNPNVSFNFNSRLCYKMVSKPLLGLCKIINNVNFEYLSRRDGSDVDAASLNRIFSEMGYKVLPEDNLTAYEMRVSLEEFAAHDCWATVDSCIVIILSHGASSNNLDFIYGTDGDFLEKMEIYSMFDNNNCKQLRGKPKIFIFQACRGDNEDSGVIVTEATDAAKFIKLPSMSDMLIVHSALPNHASYRDEIKGTWFCQDFVQVLCNDYLKDSLETMLQTVDRKIESRMSLTRKKQVTHIDKFGVKADIYFCLRTMTVLPKFYTPLCSP